MNKNVGVGVRAGPPNTKIISPAAASRIGGHYGNHAEGVTVRPPPQPLVTGTRPQVPLGNALATNVGQGGPGAGRNVQLRGAQGQHGPAAPGQPRPQGQDIFVSFPGKKG